MEIEYIQDRVKAGDFRFTKHATIKRINRHISVTEVREAILCGEIIERYRYDKYCPSVLILGFTQERRPLHVLCSYSPIVWIITTYGPDRDKWLNYRVRRK